MGIEKYDEGKYWIEMTCVCICRPLVSVYHICFHCHLPLRQIHIRPNSPLILTRPCCCTASLITNSDSFEVGRLIGNYGFMNITTFSGSPGIDAGYSSKDLGRQDVGEGSIKIRLYDGRVRQGPLKGAPVFFKTWNTVRRTWRRASSAGAYTPMDKRAFGLADDIYEAGLFFAYLAFVPFCEAGTMDGLSFYIQEDAETYRRESKMGDEWKHTALLVIDMQKDFIDRDGPVLVKGGKAIVSNVKKTVQIARQRGILIVWVVREHDPLGRDVELFRRHLYPVGEEGPTVKGKVGSELVDELVIEDGDYKVVKSRFSAFFATQLDSVLKSIGIDSLVVVGVQTPNCIRQTVFDGVALDYKSITVIVDATAAATAEVHVANICDMQNVGVATPTLQEWVELGA